MAKYEITAHTSDVRGAGMDGAVYVTLYGENGTTDEITLYQSAEVRHDLYTQTHTHTHTHHYRPFVVACEPYPISSSHNASSK